MLDPREISPGSNMPSYAHLAEARVDFAGSAGKLRALRTAGVPYGPEQIGRAAEDARRDAEALVAELAAEGQAKVAPDAELVALIAYLQRLGAQPPRAPGVAVAAAADSSPKGGR
jgi:cytochrome c oxidase cbb3-type subunit I/II